MIGYVFPSPGIADRAEEALVKQSTQDSDGRGITGPAAHE